jgi:hypothetical protein
MQDEISMTREQFNELDRLISRADECVGKMYAAAMPSESSATFRTLEADEALIFV